MKVLIFGNSGAGKTYLASRLAQNLNCVWFNGDSVRKHINSHLGFSIEDRRKQCNTMKYLSDAVSISGGIVICDFICPLKEFRLFFNADFSIYMNVGIGSYEDTNKIFEKPTDEKIDLTIDSWDYNINDIVNLILEQKVRDK
jgi:adenylylsulfate kinase